MTLPADAGWPTELLIAEYASSYGLSATIDRCGVVAGPWQMGKDRPGDIPIYISDCTCLHGLTDWRPQRGPREILADIHAWIADNETALGAALE